MIEVEGDLWSNMCEVTCITTNGDVNRYGMAVMGRGTAKQCAQAYPETKMNLGWMLEAFGNIPQIIHVGPLIVSFPVKHHWKDIADIELIEKSMGRLIAMTDLFNWRRVALPRPGCGNGKLSWNKVKDILLPITDDRFYIYNLENAHD